MLKVVFWNIWGHRVPNGVNFRLREMAGQEIDIICLTEVTHMYKPYSPVPAVYGSLDRNEPPSCINGLGQIHDVLRHEYEIHYASPTQQTWQCKQTNDTYENIGFGSALLIKRGLTVLPGFNTVFEADDDSREKHRVLQPVLCNVGGTNYLIAHLHGIWLEGNTKGDDPRRNQQSLFVRRQLRQLCEEYEVEKVIFGGDLNLAIETEALSLLEQGEPGDKPWRNLVREYGIENTRTPRYRKFNVDSEPKHADYVLVSPTVKVHQFLVDTACTASDHAPLLVEFS